MWIFGIFIRVSVQQIVQQGHKGNPKTTESSGAKIRITHRHKAPKIRSTLTFVHKKGKHNWWQHMRVGEKTQGQRPWRETMSRRHKWNRRTFTIKTDNSKLDTDLKHQWTIENQQKTPGNYNWLYKHSDKRLLIHHIWIEQNSFPKSCTL